ncbi:MAG TPA: hypothetical protein VK256_09565 [Candidatus Eisenbacteria bacterium]|nr:hypothetical protein [Candidatus Eisenbacteria bacterium]
MRLARAFFWLYPAVLLVVGIGFLVASLSQAGAADEYRRAPRCGAEVTSSCYDVITGTITSVQVRNGRGGERDDVIIETAAAGTLSVTLTPSASAAPHVRTGASVTVKRFRGAVTLIGVDGYGVPSTSDPISNQTTTSYTGLVFIGLGVVSAAFPYFYARRRRNRYAESGVMETPVTEILPTGNLGSSVRPQANLSTLARYGIGAALLLVLTFRALVDPARTIWALLLDSAIVVVVVGLLLLFFRNARVFVDKEQVGKIDMLGRLKTLSLRDVKGAERFSVLNRYGSVKHLVFVGPDGRKAFEVAGSAWDFDRLDALCREAGIELGGTYYETVSPFRLNKRVPGTITWGRQLLIALGVIAVIVPFIFLIVGPLQR